MIALIAGTGALPGILVEALVARGQPPLICQMDGFAPDVRPDLPRLGFRIETLGTMLAALKTASVTQICLAGAMRRPMIEVGAFDALTAPLLPALQVALAKGDDGTLRAMIAIIEAQGFKVIGADGIAPDLLPPAGIPTQIGPGPEHPADAVTGLAAIARMGRADLGQACVVQAGDVLTCEDDAGTDAMLRGLALARRAGLSGGSSALSGGLATQAILVKSPKPGQDRRADLPVIGPQTALLAAEAGLAGIVITAGGVMVIDQPRVVSVLDGQGMFLWVRACQTP